MSANGEPKPQGDVASSTTSLTSCTRNNAAVSHQQSLPVSVGSRVMYLEDSAVGTVKYVGPIAVEGKSVQVIWYGVDWDEGEDRGRHDGTYNGVRYFQARGSSTASFVRAGSKQLHTGLSFMQAVEERYMEELTLPGQADDLLFFGSNQVATQIELVGMDRMQDMLRQLGSLRALHLSDSPLAVAGNDAVRALEELPRVRTLNMAHCLLNSWTEVGLIAKNIRLLMQLVLSRNCLSLPAPDDKESLEMLSTAFKNVNHLVLVSTHLSSWESVVRIGDWFPKLDRLVLAYNSIPSLAADLPWCLQLQSLTIIDLSNNPLNGGPDKFALLARLSLLRSLVLSGCGLTDFNLPVAPGAQEDAVCWPQLRSLVLTWNKISSWNFLNEVNRITSLIELSFFENPVYKECDNPETARQIMMASVASVVILNHVEVSDKERRGAERDYLKRYGKAWLAAGGGSTGGEDNTGTVGVSDSFLLAHPRWAELCRIHGAPEAGEFAEQSRALKAELLTVTITVEGLPDVKSIGRRLPSSMSVAHLRSLVRRLFRLGPTRELTLLYRSHRDPERLEYILDRDTRNLAYYEVENEDCIVVRVEVD